MRAAILLSLSLTACATASAGRGLSSDELVPWTHQGSVDSAELNGLAIVRADGRDLVLYNLPATDNLSVADLAAHERLAVATNASMFAQDYATSIGYMRNYGVVNNPHVSSTLQGFLCFHPKNSRDPALKVGTAADLPNYDTVIQTYRMWTEKDGILWKEGASVYEQVALAGVDRAGHVLFFYHPEFIDVHDLVAQILTLNLDLTGLLYLDGGHHGVLYLDKDPAGLSGNAALHLPNVLGILAN